MKEALDFLKDNKEVAFATVGEGNCPKIRVFQIMKMDMLPNSMKPLSMS